MFVNEELKIRKCVTRPLRAEFDPSCSWISTIALAKDIVWKNENDTVLSDRKHGMTTYHSSSRPLKRFLVCRLEQILI